MAGMKYSDIVDYDKLDPFKEECIRRFKGTLSFPNRFGIKIVPETIGETAVALEIDGVDGLYFAFGVEGLGTKNMIAESMAEKAKIIEAFKTRRRELFSGIGRDEMAMTLNDLGGIGAFPLAFEPIVATGSSDYLTDPEVASGLIDGFTKGAQIARVAIPGGETPTLKGIVYPNTIDLAGGSIGIIKPKSHLTVGTGLEPGLAIYGIASSGIHSNGVSLARKIAEKSKEGYFTKLPSGRTIGEKLLTPTTIYAPFIEDLFIQGADIRYMQPITGHGFGKIMRKPRDLAYIIENVPEPKEEFKFLQENGPVDDEEAYRAWNMGVGWVVFAPKSESRKVRIAGAMNNLEVYEMGEIKKGKRQVVIAPKNITYKPK